MISMVTEMAKKKSTRDSGRKVEVTADDLSLMSDEISSRVGQLSRLADILREAETSIVSDGPNQYGRAVKTLDAFIRNIKKAMVDEGFDFMG